MVEPLNHIWTKSSISWTVTPTRSSHSFSRIPRTFLFRTYGSPYSTRPVSFHLIPRITWRNILNWTCVFPCRLHADGLCSSSTRDVARWLAHAWRDDRVRQTSCYIHGQRRGDRTYCQFHPSPIQNGTPLLYKIRLPSPRLWFRLLTSTLSPIT